MDWQAAQFDWNHARAFLVTAEEGSLSAAARALGLSQPTLGRQVEALQHQLGVVLFERFGRGLELTPAGSDLLKYVRQMGDGALSLQLAAQGHSSDMAGPVTLSASDLYAGLILPKILHQLKAQEPRIHIRILAENTASDLMRREADIALRNFRPAEPELIARRILDTEASFFASCDYVHTHGLITSNADWDRANLIVPNPASDVLRALQQFHIPATAASVAYECSSYLAMWEMVKQGLGVGLLDTAIGDADPKVTRAVQNYPNIPFPLWLVAHRDILSNQRIRYVFDYLAKALGR